MSSKSGLGTGGAVADFDNDGILELLVSHGERVGQPLTMYKVQNQEIKHNQFLRILVRTQGGAPAR